MAVRSDKGKATKRYESFSKKNAEWHAKVEKSVKHLDRAAKRAAARRRAAS